LAVVLEVVTVAVAWLAALAVVAVHLGVEQLLVAQEQEIKVMQVAHLQA
jgi:hypothetical protein